MSPLTWTTDSTSTRTLSPSTDSESAIDAASWRADCKEALASRAWTAFDSLVAFVVRAFLWDFGAGVEDLPGELALGRPRARGVEPRGVGGGRCVLSFAAKTNFGGGDIDF